MQQNAFQFLYSALFYPKSLLSPKSDENNVNSVILGKISKVNLICLSLIFALYILGFTYKPSIWHIQSSDPFYPYLGLINAGSLIVIGLVFYWIWVGIDSLFLKIVIPRMSSEHRNYTLLTTQTPWLALIPYFVIMRLLFAGSYYPWNYQWLALLHIILVFGWHYLNMGTVLIELKDKSAIQKKIPILIGIYLIFLSGILLILVKYVPIAFGAEASVFLSQIF